MSAYPTHRGPGPFKIFLSGGTSDWRAKVALRLKGYHVDLYDPFECSDQQAIMDFTSQDLFAAADSHLVLAYHDFDPLYGLSMECTAAYVAGVPVIYVSMQKRPISMVLGISRAVFADLEEAVTFIIKRFKIMTIAAAEDMAMTPSSERHTR